MSRRTFESPWRLARMILLLITVITMSGSGLTYRQIADKATVDGQTHNGVELQIDLPESQHVKNFGAPADGKGLCVFASMTMAARWHHVRQLSDIIHKINVHNGPVRCMQVNERLLSSSHFIVFSSPLTF